MSIHVALLASCLLAACAPAPLYTGNSRVKGAVTHGEIPRDARGEPVWSAIRPAGEPATSQPEDSSSRLHGTQAPPD